MSGFQSLIGRLKTDPISLTVMEYSEGFQSLIGRLKTVCASYIFIYISMFQSLIGRLKTHSL